jgi:serine/threonine protein kinase
MDCCNIPFEWDDGDFGDTYESEESLALDLADKMMTIDPYHRPNTTELLKHPFFTKRSQRKKEEIKEHFPAIEYYFATRGKILFNKALPVAEEG